MLDHVTIRVSDREASTRFYDTVLGTLGLRSEADEEYTEWGGFSIASATEAKPVTRNLHVAFFAASRELVDAFWQAGIDAGHPSDGEPGPRPEYADDYYGAFLLDPDGNSVEAVHLDRDGEPRLVDHLWIRVADVAVAREFYETVAPHVGITLGADLPDRAQFQGTAGSLSLVEGEPTQNVHLAFGVADHDAVDAFHAAAVAAGHTSDGVPGERPEYHPGYYGAFVLDPDGNSVEAVHHGGRD